MLIETLDKVKDLFNKVTGAHQEDNEYRAKAQDELFELLKDVVINDDQRKEMNSWLRDTEEDEGFIEFLKQQIISVRNGIYYPSNLTKEDLYAALDAAVEDDKSGGRTTGYEDLMECIEDLIDARAFGVLQEVFTEITEKIEAQDNLEHNHACFDVFLEVFYYVVSNIFHPETVDGEDVIKASTLYSLPIILTSKNGVIETPNLNMLSKIIKKSLKKRGIIAHEDYVNVATAISNSAEMSRMGFEDYWGLHNNILFDYDTGMKSKVRTEIQEHNGETSLIYCFITLNLISKENDVERRFVEVDLMTGAFKDKELWRDIGNALETVKTKFTVYPPEDLLDSLNNIDLMRDITRFRVILARQSKNNDLLYAEMDNGSDITVMFVDKETGLLNMIYSFEPGLNSSFVLLELEELTKKHDMLLYKYKHKMKTRDFNEIQKLGETDSNIDISKYTSQSILVDDEWKGWLVPGQLSGKKTLQ